MNDLKRAALRTAGLAMIALAALICSAMCGDVYGRAHAGDTR